MQEQIQQIFFKFAKNKLNELGLKLYGDFPIGFSHDEVWAFPQTFKKGYYMGLPKWHIPALNMDRVLTEGSSANRLLKMKLALAASRYDSLRMDSAWGYISPIITPAGEKKYWAKTGDTSVPKFLIIWKII